ncbi:glycosyltransferase family 2 protein [Klebsiella pneumoniae]|uniref:glycosyltransferase family 2 protein n=1 Tax=Klebsiella pneumoniae TaxID=573 RepID=UPI003F57C183
MTTTKISAILTCYNDAPVFRRALMSVTEQTCKVDEIIIVDDCSNDSDELIKIINDFSEFNIQYFRNEINKNGAFSRNFGIEHSHGDYIALLDGDDFWEIEHVEKNISFLHDHKCDFIYSNVFHLQKDGKVIKRKCTDISELSNAFDILFYSPPQTNSFFFKKKIFPEVKFDESLRRHQDYQFLISCIANQNICIGYNDNYTTYYCESHREPSSRVNFESVFKFWDMNRNKFSELLLNKFLISQLHSSISIVGGGGVKNYFSNFSVLNSTSLSSKLYIKYIKYVNLNTFISRKIEFIFYHLMYGRLRICKKD